MPRLWDHTIETHREAVREAILTTTARLVAAHGVASLTMSQVAEETGIGRGTLYKYFPDLDGILRAWHDRQVERHLRRLVEVRNEAPADTRLEAVLVEYGMLAFASRQADGEVANALHHDEQVAGAQRRVENLVRAVIAEDARRGAARQDVAPEELARYALHAMSAARGARSRPAVQRLVGLTLAGIRR